MARFVCDIHTDRIRGHRVVLPDTDEPIDLTRWFGERPVELEIGFGKGRFLLRAATEHPDRAFLGIEVKELLCQYAALRLAKRELDNARVARVGVHAFFLRHLRPATLRAIHLYFPDPWWKNRHRKRRVWSGPLLAQYRDALEQDGRLHLASDVPEVFREMTALADATPGLARDDDADAPTCTTNFEDKAIAAGRRVGRAVYRRCGESAC